MIGEPYYKCKTVYNDTLLLSIRSMYISVQSNSVHISDGTEITSRTMYEFIMNLMDGYYLIDTVFDFDPSHIFRVYIQFEEDKIIFRSNKYRNFDGMLIGLKEILL